MHPYVNTAVRAAKSAGNILARAFERPDLMKITKKGPGDFVTNVDKKIEQEIVRLLQTAYPNHGFIGEEGTIIKGDGHQWIIDPIDGTTNFIQGIPHFCISIALQHENRIEHGVVFDPMTNDLFTASRGEGAQKNNHRIRVSQKRHFSEGLIGVGSRIRSPEFHEQFYDAFKNVLDSCSSYRRLGAGALDLAYVASGHLDGFYETGLHIWDIAAGVLLVKEAGGLVSDTDGAENYFKNGRIVAGNPFIFKELLKKVQPFLSESAIK